MAKRMSAVGRRFPPTASPCRLSPMPAATRFRQARPPWTAPASTVARATSSIPTRTPIVPVIPKLGRSPSTSPCRRPSPMFRRTAALPCLVWWMSTARRYRPSLTSAATPSSRSSTTAPPPSTPTGQEPWSSRTHTRTARDTTPSGPTPTRSTRLPSHPLLMRTPLSTASAK